MSEAPGRRHVLDRWVRRRGGGRLLVGGSPARLVRLSPAGSDAIDRLLAGTAGPEATLLRGRLRAHGMLHPLALPAPPSQPPLTFVVPSRDGGPELAVLVAQLRAWGEVIVVDDRSRDGSPQLAADAGATVLANAGLPGPAAARNTGLAAVDTEYVAMIDADCSCPTEWAAPLAALLAEEPELALAAPRVRSAPAAGLIARYERHGSPLDMGPHPGLCGPGRAVPYVPSTALVARRSALLELGGFDEGLRFGEDVDLAWRALEHGWSVRYAPEVEVEHQPRQSLAAWARQRFDYGGSAVALRQRHADAVAPLRLAPLPAATWLAAAGGGVGAGLVVAAAAACFTGARREDQSARLAVTELAFRSQLAAIRQLARAAYREWLPLTTAATLTSPRARRLAASLLLIELAASGSGRSPDERLPATFPLLHLLDNAAYGSGLWRASLRERSPAALLPTLRRG